jgi:hypothetical protein
VPDRLDSQSLRKQRTWVLSTWSSAGRWNFGAGICRKVCFSGRHVIGMALTSDETFNVDKVVLATGYKVNIARLPYLAAGNLLDQLETRNGYPVLDDYFQTSIPGLFITSMPATQDFGPFFGFTVSVRTSAKLISHRFHA